MNLIPVTQYTYAGNELKYLQEVLESKWLGGGPFVERFEKTFSGYCDMKYGCAVSNGTNALYLIYKVLGIGPGDEVIVPDNTFITPASMALHAGAKPVPVDVQSDTFNIDPVAVEKAITPRTKAIVPVHMLGHPADMDEINEIAAAHDIRVIEDAAEAHGAIYRKRKAGSLAPISFFSFYGNKTIASGEGGMILSDDHEFIETCRLQRGHGMRPEKRYWHEVIGYNYRMTDLQAAVGVAQLEKIDAFLERKHRIAKMYSELLSGVKGIILPTVREYATHSYWMYQILVTDEFPISRDELAVELRKKNIDTRRAFYSVHVQPPYRAEGNFPNSDICSATGLMIPMGANLTDDQVAYVADAIRGIGDQRA
ncbi:MAG: DegT/DnrJ/EryC1/StrS family aminotransferase [Candidatus Diapherotrites archaeon]|nr:DegT/DnrJ/EryC1/StrS family aminotransferase [Candidatus Diapherotrites archaeon]